MKVLEERRNYDPVSLNVGGAELFEDKKRISLLPLPLSLVLNCHYVCRQIFSWLFMNADRLPTHSPFLPNPLHSFIHQKLPFALVENCQPTRNFNNFIHSLNITYDEIYLLLFISNLLHSLIIL